MKRFTFDKRFTWRGVPSDPADPCLPRVRQVQRELQEIVSDLKWRCGREKYHDHELLRNLDAVQASLQDAHDRAAGAL